MNSENIVGRRCSNQLMNEFGAIPLSSHCSQENMMERKINDSRGLFYENDYLEKNVYRSINKAPNPLHLNRQGFDFPTYHTNASMFMKTTQAVDMRLKTINETVGKFSQNILIANDRSIKPCDSLNPIMHPVQGIQKISCNEKINGLFIGREERHENIASKLLSQGSDNECRKLLDSCDELNTQNDFRKGEQSKFPRHTESSFQVSGPFLGTVFNPNSCNGRMTTGPPLDSSLQNYSGKTLKENRYNMATNIPNLVAEPRSSNSVAEQRSSNSVAEQRSSNSVETVPSDAGKQLILMNNRSSLPPGTITSVSNQSTISHHIGKAPHLGRCAESESGKLYPKFERGVSSIQRNVSNNLSSQQELNNSQNLYKSQFVQRKDSVVPFSSEKVTSSDVGFLNQQYGYNSRGSLVFLSSNVLESVDTLKKFALTKNVPKKPASDSVLRSSVLPKIDASLKLSVADTFKNSKTCIAEQAKFVDDQQNNPQTNTLVRRGMAKTALSSTKPLDNYCSSCRTETVIISDCIIGDLICSECGLVLEGRMVNHEQEWRNFSNDNSGGRGSGRDRAGGTADKWLEDGSSGTTILGGSKRLLQAHDSAVSAGGTAEGPCSRILKNSFVSLKLISEAFSLSEGIYEIAKDIAKSLNTNGALSHSTVYMLAIIYLACKEGGCTRQIRELVVYDKSIGERKLGKIVLKLKRLLPDRANTGFYSGESITEIMPRICSKLNLNVYTMDCCIHVCQVFMNNISKIHKISSIAAASVFLLCQATPNLSHILPSHIASVTGTTESTLRGIYKQMAPIGKLLLPKEFSPGIAGGKPGDIREKKKK